MRPQKRIYSQISALQNLFQRAGIKRRDPRGLKGELVVKEKA
jgi:hypothetical protein